MNISLDRKIEAARRRAEAEKRSGQPGTTFEDGEQYQHLKNINAPGTAGNAPNTQPEFEDTAADWSSVLVARACRGCGCDTDPLFSHAVNGQAPFCGDCYLQSTPGFSGPDDGSGLIDSALREIADLARSTDLDDGDRAEVLSMLYNIRTFLVA